MEKDRLRLVVLENASELGEKVDKHLQKIRGSKESFIVPVETIRFNNGEGKAKLGNSIRAKDVYILSDSGNYSCTYEMFGFTNHKSPDDHFQDLKRVIYAMRGHASKMTAITPLLYESRQHRRKGRESLDSAVALQDLVHLDVKNIVTFDTHDIGIQNAIPLSCFDNFYPTNTIIREFVKEENVDFNNMLVIAPDNGAVGRAMLYADMFRCNVGMFHKRRDLTKVVNGKNPIIEHKYIGEDVTGKSVFVVDDMIASGSSVLDVAFELKKRGAEQIYLNATFALFTNGINAFQDAYEKGYLNKIYTTNLTYIPEAYKNIPWLKIVDCSYQIAQVINALHNEESIAPLLNGKQAILDEIDKRIDEER